MKQYLLLSFLCIPLFHGLCASDDLKRDNYGLWAAREFASVAFVSPKDEPFLAMTAADLGLRDVHFHPTLKQWTIGVGPSVYKAAQGLDTLNLSEYRMEDGEDLEAQITAYKDRHNRVHSFFLDGTPVQSPRARKYFDQSAALQNVLAARDGVKKVKREKAALEREKKKEFEGFICAQENDKKTRASRHRRQW